MKTLGKVGMISSLAAFAVVAAGCMQPGSSEDKSGQTEQATFTVGNIVMGNMVIAPPPPPPPIPTGATCTVGGTACANNGQCLYVSSSSATDNASQGGYRCRNYDAPMFVSANAPTYYTKGCQPGATGCTNYDPQAGTSVNMKRIPAGSQNVYIAAKEMSVTGIPVVRSLNSYGQVWPPSAVPVVSQSFLQAAQPSGRSLNTMTAEILAFYKLWCRTGVCTDPGGDLTNEPYRINYNNLRSFGSCLRGNPLDAYKTGPTSTGLGSSLTPVVNRCAPLFEVVEAGVTKYFTLELKFRPNGAGSIKNCNPGSWGANPVLNGGGVSDNKALPNDTSPARGCSYSDYGSSSPKFSTSRLAGEINSSGETTESITENADFYSGSGQEGQGCLASVGVDWYIHGGAPCVPSAWNGNLGWHCAKNRLLGPNQYIPDPAANSGTYGWQRDWPVTFPIFFPSNATVATYTNGTVASPGRIIGSTCMLL